MSYRRINQGVSSNALVNNLNAQMVGGVQSSKLAQSFTYNISTQNFSDWNEIKDLFGTLVVEGDSNALLTNGPSRSYSYGLSFNMSSVSGRARDVILVFYDGFRENPLIRMRTGNSWTDWKHLAFEEDLQNYVTKQQLQDALNELKSEIMQITDNQQNMGGGITRFAISPYIVTVKKGGSHNERGGYQCDTAAVPEILRRPEACHRHRQYNRTRSLYSLGCCGDHTERKRFPILYGYPLLFQVQCSGPDCNWLEYRKYVLSLEKRRQQHSNLEGLEKSELHRNDLTRKEVVAQ